MSRALLILDSPMARQRASTWAHKAPHGTRVEFKASKRSLPQNDRMWAMLTDLAQQLPWHGLTLKPDSWKLLFLDALKREVRAVPNLDGTGFVNIGRSSSDLSKAEMGDLMTLIEEFGARHGVVAVGSTAVVPEEVDGTPLRPQRSARRSRGVFNPEAECEKHQAGRLSVGADERSRARGAFARFAGSPFLAWPRLEEKRPAVALAYLLAALPQAEAKVSA